VKRLGRESTQDDDGGARSVSVFSCVRSSALFFKL